MSTVLFAMLSVEEKRARKRTSQVTGATVEARPHFYGASPWGGVSLGLSRKGFMADDASHLGDKSSEEMFLDLDSVIFSALY